MIKIENVDIFGWETAIRGMRNPLNSWSKSDSEFTPWDNTDFKIGEADLKLMKNLSKAGSDHAKFLRMINVTFDIVAPRYWYTEFDTYKVGTVSNSCSTMHTIHKKNFELSDFSYESMCTTAYGLLLEIIDILNDFRSKFLETKNKMYWYSMIQLLPQSYNQRRTVQLNYEVLKSMYHARKNHKLDCWVQFCKWIETLPYAKELICYE